MKSMIACAVLALGLSAGSTALAGEVFKVSFEVREAGERRAAPVAMVRADTEATLAEDGEGGYSIRFDVSRASDDTVRLSAHYASAAHTLAPVVEVALGETASVRTESEAGAVELSVQVEAVDLQALQQLQ
ncbi:MAG: hypothetical protein ACXIUZ_03085 [Lysobacteraceae bacterium]